MTKGKQKTHQDASIASTEGTPISVPPLDSMTRDLTDFIEYLLHKYRLRRDHPKVREIYQVLDTPSTAPQLALVPMPDMSERQCRNCGFLFTPKRPWQTFCSARCRGKISARTRPKKKPATTK